MLDADDPGAADWFRSLVDGAADITFVLDDDGRVQFASAAVERILDYEPTALLGEPVEEYIHPDDRAEFVDARTPLEADTVSPTGLGVRFRTAAGSWCQLAFTFRSPEAEGIDGILASAQDRSNRRDSEDPPANTVERMELALEGANLGIWDWDMTSDEVTRDELLTEMLGYTPAEMGDDLSDWQRLVHPAGERRHEAALTEHVENRTPYYQCEYRLETKSGDWKWVRTIGKVVERDDQGTPTRAVGLHQDIDDRKRAELALQEERDLFRAGPAVVFEWRDEAGWPVEYVSDNVEERFGYAPTELQSSSRSFAELVHEADLPRLKQQVAEQIKAGNTQLHPDPYRLRTADGDIRWVMEFTRRLHKPNGETVLLGYLVDITERKARERELRNREEKYRSLFEDNRDALMVLDRDCYLDCNQRTLELFGIDSVEAFLEYTPWDLAPSQQPDGTDSKALAQEQIASAFETGEAFFEFTHQRADGTEFPSEVKLSKFQVDGKPAVHALVRNITERKQYQAQLQTQRDNLEILNQIVRHDIRNELQTILGYADVLKAEATGTNAEHVQQVLSSARHATDITETAREVSEILLQADVDLKPVSFKHVLEDAVTNIQMSREQAVVGIDGMIPSVTVIANELLGSVFRNLLSNAVDHNDKAVPKVRISAAIRDNDVLVRIADNGPGIPDDRKEIIFEEGEQGIESEGTGLGLYLVQTLVSQYDGDVWVENSTGQDSEMEGATFNVTVPLAE